MNCYKSRTAFVFHDMTTFVQQKLSIVYPSKESYHPTKIFQNSTSECHEHFSLIRTWNIIVRVLSTCHSGPDRSTDYSSAKKSIFSYSVFIELALLSKRPSLSRTTKLTRFNKNSFLFFESWTNENSGWTNVVKSWSSAVRLKVDEKVHRTQMPHFWKFSFGDNIFSKGESWSNRGQTSAACFLQKFAFGRWQL